MNKSLTHSFYRTGSHQAPPETPQCPAGQRSIKSLSRCWECKQTFGGHTHDYFSLIPTESWDFRNTQRLTENRLILYVNTPRFCSHFFFFFFFTTSSVQQTHPTFLVFYTHFLGSNCSVIKCSARGNT